MGDIEKMFWSNDGMFVASMTLDSGEVAMGQGDFAGIYQRYCILRNQPKWF